MHTKLNPPNFATPSRKYFFLSLREDIILCSKDDNYIHQMTVINMFEWVVVLSYNFVGMCTYLFTYL